MAGDTGFPITVVIEFSLEKSVVVLLRFTLESSEELSKILSGFHLRCWDFEKLPKGMKPPFQRAAA